MRFRVEIWLRARRPENSIEWIETNNYSTKSFSHQGTTDFLQFIITLDAEVKDYKSRVYGFIDAIGTLGGAFEIISWIVLLLYGSIRKNLYYFSTLNSLTNENPHKNDESEIDEQHLDNDGISRNRPLQLQSQSKTRLWETKMHKTTHQQTNTKFKRDIF